MIKVDMSQVVKVVQEMKATMEAGKDELRQVRMTEVAQKDN